MPFRTLCCPPEPADEAPRRARRWLSDFPVQSSYSANRLHRFRMAIEHRANPVPGLPAVDARRECADLPAFLHLLDRPRQPLVIQPAVFPSMKLHDIDCLDPEILEALFNVILDVSRRKAILEREFATARPAPVLRRNFRGHIEMLVGPADAGPVLVLAQDLGKNLLAPSVAIGPGGIKEIAAELHGASERSERFRVMRSGPAR